MKNIHSRITLNAKQLRKLSVDKEIENVFRNEIYIVLEDVLDTYNIGSVFRLADAIGAKKVYLCGGTETPPNSRIKKSSINTTEIVQWEYAERAPEVIKKLKAEHITIVAVEQTNTSIPYDSYTYPIPICVVVGNESYGVSEEVLQIADVIVELPMFGINVSLNVMVSLAIVLYQIIESNQQLVTQ